MRRRWLVIPIVAAVAAPASAIADHGRPSADDAVIVQARPTPETMLEGFARRLDADEQRVRSGIADALRATRPDDPPSGDRPFDRLRDRFLADLAGRLDRPADRVADAAGDQLREGTAQAVDAGVMTDEQRQGILDWWEDPDSGPLPRPRAHVPPGAGPAPQSPGGEAVPG